MVATAGLSVHRTTELEPHTVVDVCGGGLWHGGALPRCPTCLSFGLAVDGPLAVTATLLTSLACATEFRSPYTVIHGPVRWRATGSRILDCTQQPCKITARSGASFRA